MAKITVCAFSLMFFLKSPLSVNTPWIHFLTCGEGRSGLGKSELGLTGANGRDRKPPQPPFSYGGVGITNNR